ncbi:MAG TPA: protein kinase [Candidatus Acidoferrum sp.]|nr:protein kinase [Candidatus Acidoferrum sp.]
MKCGTRLPVRNPGIPASGSGPAAAPAAEQTIMGDETEYGQQRVRTHAEGGTTAYGEFRAGSLLGGRFEILRQLGEGGMGRVFQARDRELDRVVALKIIRPELAQNAQTLQRFKQELILARQVTHRHVIRIHDLGEADGIKFISMDFIEGQDLRSLLQAKGKFAPEEAGRIIEQVCEALEAAHSEGVIHRDLKPQNIMVDPQGKVTVMDFGIARGLETAGVTQPGALVGTPQYMSPEQACGETVDARSDLFSLGIILYELLTGNSPFKAATKTSSFFERMTERARPPIELVSEIPKPLSDIAVRCLEIDKAKRYGRAREILQDLGAWLGPREGTRVIVADNRSARWKFGAGAIGVVIAVSAGAFIFRQKLLASRPVTHKEVSVLVADFSNNTAESVFDETLEPAFIIGLEGSPFIESFPRSTARKLAAQLRPGAAMVDEAAARLVATREGIDVIVVGSIDKERDEYAIRIKAVDGITGNTINSKDSRVSKQNVFSAVGKLAAGIRSVLGDTTPESLKLSAQETFTADSVEAVHEYAEAQNLQWDGRWEEALPHFEQAIKLDPNMGRAYAGYAVASLNLGRHDDAAKYFQEAMTHIDRMTDREKYRTRASYYIMQREPRKAIEEYEALLKLYPYDDAAHSNLAISHFYLREMDKAVEVERRDVEINPRGLMQRTNLSLYESYDGDFANAVKDAQEVLKQNPKSVSGLGALAMGWFGQGKIAEATAAYEKMRPISARGASSSATGLADIALYEGRLKDAIEILERGIANDQTNKNAEASALKLNYLAYAYLMQGDLLRAMAATERARALNRVPSTLYLAGRAEAALGQSAKSMNLASELSSQLSADPQAYGKLIQGELALKNGNAQEALQIFQQAEKLADAWLVHFDLGRAYLDSGAFSEATSEFDACMKRRGEAAAVFLDDVPSFYLYPPVLYYQGLAHEGLKNARAAEYFKQFLAIKSKGAGDPMITGARRHLENYH